LSFKEEGRISMKKSIRVRSGIKIRKRN